MDLGGLCAEVVINADTFRRGCQLCTEGTFEVYYLENLIRLAHTNPDAFLPGLAPAIIHSFGYSPNDFTK